MIAKNKLETLEEICLSITKDDIGAYTFPPDEMMNHILSLNRHQRGFLFMVGCVDLVNKTEVKGEI